MTEQKVRRSNSNYTTRGTPCTKRGEEGTKGTNMCWVRFGWGGGEAAETNAKKKRRHLPVGWVEEGTGLTREDRETKR